MAFLKFIARLVFWLLAIFGALSLVAVAGVVVLVLGFEHPRKPIQDRSILTFDLAEGLPETSPVSWLEPWRRTMTLPDFVMALDAAGKDPRISGLMLRVGGPALDMARAQEIREAIRAFRANGKQVHAYAESFGEAGNGTTLYYVASATDRIFLQPSGEVGLLGFRLEMPFVKGALDWLGIEARTTQRREYKGVPYIFTESTMPAPLRQNLQRVANSWLKQLAEDVAVDRKTRVDVVRRWIDESPWSAVEAAKQGMVDALGYWGETRTSLGEESRMTRLADYWAQRPDPPANAPTVALIAAMGAVVLGTKPDDPFGDRDFIASFDMAEAVQKAVKDKVSAIVIRIDSPGGSYVAADQIWREIERAQSSGVPIIVSMVGTAASGGYFIAAPAGKIVAGPGTITGSIGVFAGKPVLKGLWEKLGISVEGVQAGDAAGADSLNADFTPESWTRLEARMDAIYDDFVSKVAKGRGLSPVEAEASAKGQIWTGVDAKDMGLVDELGGFMKALDLARNAAKLDPDTRIRLVRYPAPATPLQKIMSLIGSDPNPTAKTALLAFLREAADGRAGVLHQLADDGWAGPLWLPPIVVNGDSR